MGHVCNLDQVPASTGAAWVDETPINRAFTASVHGSRTSPWTLEGTWWAVVAVVAVQGWLLGPIPTVKGSRCLRKVDSEAHSILA